MVHIYLYTWYSMYLRLLCFLLRMSSRNFLSLNSLRTIWALRNFRNAIHREKSSAGSAMMIASSYYAHARRTYTYSVCTCARMRCRHGHMISKSHSRKRIMQCERDQCALNAHSAKPISKLFQTGFISV